jgi:hypothetical protein
VRQCANVGTALQQINRNNGSREIGLRLIIKNQNLCKTLINFLIALTLKGKK